MVKNKYMLNVLRFLTKGECSDWILKKSFNHRVEGDKFVFNFKANVNTKDWRWIKGRNEDAGQKTIQETLENQE